MTISLVAHRGDCQENFENTIQSVQTALDGGITSIEIDIQLTQDGVPILYHDRNLQRMTGVNSPVALVDLKAISELTLLQTDENISKQSHVKIATLAEIVTLIRQHCDVTLFLEVKRVNFLYFSYRDVYQKIISSLAPISKQVVLLSFSYRFLRLCRLRSDQPLAYVLPEWSNYSAKMLAKLQPKYIFCLTDIVPDNYKFLTDKITWVLYEIATVEVAKHFIGRGVCCLETFVSSQLKNQLLLEKIACK